ncbi:hypothetical protein KCM76_25470 [Zooshikella marina]|uniref:hypothetical protein n=1 Tax=Zooshikella ganghwensis TaxID=202772 RepID=UPI001BAF0105|nr:hypothetical protein [Zooshikella ganghwensis]MBU2709366.1 hypothetical protein [Zooshikella ganghwensis]
MNKKIKKAYLAECRTKHTRKHWLHSWFDRLGIVKYKAYWDDQHDEFTGFAPCIRWWHPATWFLILTAFLYIIFIAINEAVTCIIDSLIELKEIYQTIKMNAKSKGIWLN